MLTEHTRWILRSKLSAKTIIDVKGKTLFVNIETGEELDYREEKSPDIYMIEKDGVNYNVIIEDGEESTGLNIVIEKK